MRQLTTQTIQDAWLTPSAPITRVTYADIDVCESPCKKVAEGKLMVAVIQIPRFPNRRRFSSYDLRFMPSKPL